MRYSKYSASHQISARQKAKFGHAMNKNNPTAAQKKYFKYLLMTLKENGYTLRDVRDVPHSLIERTDYHQMINNVKGFLIEKGVIEESFKSNNVDKKRSQDIKNTKWISIKAKKPDRKFVKTIDDMGNIHILEWTGKVFIDQFQRACTKENERIHKYREPIAWAYLED